MIRSERGSIIVNVLILMPLLAAIFALSAGVYLIIRADAKARHVCRIELLQSQEKVGKTLDDLLALNSQAKSLRKQRDIADKAVQVAPEGASKTLALAYKAIVVARQMAFAAQQKILLFRGKTESFRGPANASQLVRSSLAEDRSAESSTSSSTHSNFERAKFDVIATPSSSLTPDYQPSPLFSQRQNMRVQWQQGISSLLPNWIQLILSSSNQMASIKLKAECAATLKKEKSKWRPILSAVSL